MHRITSDGREVGDNKDNIKSARTKNRFVGFDLIYNDKMLSQ